MADTDRIKAMIAPGEAVIWQGRAGLWRSLSIGQIIWAIIGVGLVVYGMNVLWGHYGLRSAIAGSVFRDVLSQPQRVHFRAGGALLIGMLALGGFAAAIIRARGTRFFLTPSQAFVHKRGLFSETAVVGRIQTQGQVATASNLFGAAILIPIGAGPDQDGFVAFDGLRDSEVAEVLAHIKRITGDGQGQLDAT
jgi:hypothetical protein